MPPLEGHERNGNGKTKWTFPKIFKIALLQKGIRAARYAEVSSEQG
jgi:hypothetical protein